MYKLVKKQLSAKYLCMILVLALMISCITTISTNASTEDNSTVTVEEARNVATDFIVGSLKNSDSTTNWKLGLGINESTALFDLDNNPSAYMFKLSDQQGNDSGYIVVSASKNDNPIIEFSCTGKPFTENAIETTKKITEKTHSNKKVKKDKTKLYYLGGLNYLAESELDDNTKQAYDISSGNCTIVNIDELKKIKPKKNKTTKYFKLWDESSKNHLKETKDGSTPPDEYNVFITDPNQYETNYNGVNSKDVTGYNRSYNLMTDFSTGGVCSPTTATNLCKYWYGRNPTKYAKLYDNNYWKDTFKSFYTLMKTDSSGTVRDNIPPAYVAYFKSKGLSCTSVLTNGTNSGKKVEDELNNDRPCHLHLINSYTYSNGDGAHSVLALGYKDYWYSSLSGWVDNYIYIRIADGWTNTPIRFVYGECHGSWSYTTVIPS